MRKGRLLLARFSPENCICFHKLSNTAHRFAHVTPSTGGDALSELHYLARKLRKCFIHMCFGGWGFPKETVFLPQATSLAAIFLRSQAGSEFSAGMLTKYCLLIGDGSHVESHSQVNFVGPRRAPGVGSKHQEKSYATLMVS